jgi:hypothetical protein
MTLTALDTTDTSEVGVQGLPFPASHNQAAITSYGDSYAQGKLASDDRLTGVGFEVEGSFMYPRKINTYGATYGFHTVGFNTSGQIKFSFSYYTNS